MSQSIKRTISYDQDGWELICDSLSSDKTDEEVLFQLQYEFNLPTLEAKRIVETREEFLNYNGPE